MHCTISATPLESVHVESVGQVCSEVWLRKNITEFIEDGQTMYCADETSAIIGGKPTAAEIEPDFETWWERVEEASMSDSEKFEKLQAQVLFTALMTDTEV